MKVERWSVWLVNFDPVIGSEQGRTRPALAISDSQLNDILPVVNVLPINSRKPGRRIYPNEALLPAGVAGLPAESIALCYQIRTIDKRRLIRKFGEVNDVALQAEIVAALRFQIGL